MIAPITPTPPTIHNAGGPHYVLIMDARGNPLALAPLQKLQHNPFPMEQIRRIDGEARVLETGAASAPPHAEAAETTFLPLVESALKHLDDPVFLCEHAQTRTRLVAFRLDASSVPATCLERVRIVRALLQEAIEQLRPVGPIPSGTVIPRREWLPYLILYCAYVEGMQNYAIMNWLQISEGTFNRTRRRALQAVAKVVYELERHAG